MSYSELTISQRISLKGIISQKRERYFLSHKNAVQSSKGFDALYALWIVCDFKVAVEHFLNN